MALYVIIRIMSFEHKQKIDNKNLIFLKAAIMSEIFDNITSGEAAQSGLLAGLGYLAGGPYGALLQGGLSLTNAFFNNPKAQATPGSRPARRRSVHVA